MIDLFPYLNSLFSNNKNWSEISDNDKSRNFFMMQRMLAKKFPIQVHHLSHLKIDAPSVSNYWHEILIKSNNSVPGWIYSKNIKSEQKKDVKLPSQEMIEWYCLQNEISQKEFQEKVNFFGDQFCKELIKQEKIMKSQGAL